MGLFTSDKTKKNSTLCRVATLNEKGRRPTQQDSFAVINEDESRFFAAVADGMGGMAHGLDAAQMAVNGITHGSRSIADSRDIPPAFEAMTIAVNKKVHDTFDGRAGTTLAAVMVLDDHLFWVSVGDSTIMLYRDGQIIRLNHEHSYKMLVKRTALFEGDLSSLQELTGADSHRLTAYVGSDELMDIDRNFYGFPLMPQDKLMLCTDGITRTIDELTIAVILKNPPEKAREIINGLIKHKANPKQDNYTAIIAEVVFEE